MPDAPSPPPPAPSPIAARTPPGPIEIYILAAGLLLGVLLGPSALGRAAPNLYAQFFGGGQATRQLAEYDAETADMIASLRNTGVTPDAVTEHLESRAIQSSARRQAREAVMDRSAFLKIVSLAVALFAVLLVEAATGSTSPAWKISRYALVAVSTGLLIARPSLLVALSSSWIT